MSVHVDTEKARMILARSTDLARTKSYTVPAEIETLISQIIAHTHLTYRYVLINGLLGKATNHAANPVTLQAGSALRGAFDARSLCHSVLVPFEQTVLEKRLGGSNEPFLNKPARYAQLSMDNAVRRGKDKQTLERLIDLFGRVDEQGMAEQALIAALHYVLQLEPRTVAFDPERFESVASKRAILALVDGLLSKSCEGESLALAVAILFELLCRAQGGGAKVVSHPANQAGSSSNEVADIDVFEADETTLRYCAEAKDKPFGRADIDHAAGKVAENNHGSLIFVYGPKGDTDEDMDAVSAEYEAKGFDLTFVSATDFAHGVVPLAGSITWDELAELINKHLGLMRAKEMTFAHFREVIDRLHRED